MPDQRYWTQDYVIGFHHLLFKKYYLYIISIHTGTYHLDSKY